MDTFEQQEMSKSRPQLKGKLNKWYDWLINHVPKPIKDGASRAFKTFKDKVMGLYNRVTGSAGNGTRIKEPKPFRPIELEQAFGGAYRSYRVNGRPKIDVDTFFNRIRKELIGLIKQELKTQTSARIQTTAWIRFVRDDEEGQERVELAFNSLMMSVYRGSEMDQIVDEMIANKKFQIENPALLNSRFVFDEFLYLDVNFHQLNLTRGSSYLPLPDWLARKKAIVNPHNDDEECFKWSVIAADNVGMKDPQRVSNLRKFTDNYGWSGLEFPVSIKDIGKFETRNNVSVNVLAVEGRDIYIHKKGRRMMGREIDLLLISEDGINHYTAIKSLVIVIPNSLVIPNKSINSSFARIACRVLRKNLAEINIKFTARTTSLLELRCLNRVQPFSSKMDRINLKSHLKCMQILNRSLNRWTLWNQDLPTPVNLISMKLINTRHLVGVFIANLLTEKLLLHLEPIEAKIASKRFVITSKEKLVDCITCFLKNRWIL